MVIDSVSLQATFVAGNLGGFLGTNWWRLEFVVVDESASPMKESSSTHRMIAANEIWRLDGRCQSEVNGSSARETIIGGFLFIRKNEAIIVRHP